MNDACEWRDKVLDSNLWAWGAQAQHSGVRLANIVERWIYRKRLHEDFANNSKSWLNTLEFASVKMTANCSAVLCLGSPFDLYGSLALIM
jgi:hypothetical protein